MNDAISEMHGIETVAATSRRLAGSRIAVPLYTSADLNSQQSQWQRPSPDSSPRNLRDIRGSTWFGGAWRLIFIFGGLMMAIPVLFITSPAMITLCQIFLGCGLAIATWMIVKYPTEEAQVLTSTKSDILFP